MNDVLVNLQQSLQQSEIAIKDAKANYKEQKAKIKQAKGVKNEAYIAQTNHDLELILSKPSECKAEIAKYKKNLSEVRASSNRNQNMVEYAKQEVKDATTRYKTAKKEVREAKKACFYAKRVGDSDAICQAQDEINNIKLLITKERLAVERVICDAKAYIKSQEEIIKSNRDLVTTKDANAIEVTNTAKEEISEAKKIISHAHKVLPFGNNFRKYYQEHTQAFEAIIALAPAACILLVFMIFPLFNTFAMSFMEDFKFKRGAGIFAIAHKFSAIGFGEYLNVLRDPIFLQALQNTVILVIISVPLTVIIALFISVALNGIKKLQGMYQTIFFLPYVTNTIALGMVFNVLFATNGGLINSIFGSDIAWLTDATSKGYWTSLVVITTYTVWNGLAFKILIFLSGLQSIDKQYYDAALIDGASKGRIFRKITVPLLSPMILYTVITSFIGAFKSYSNIIAVFGRGPNSYGPAGNNDMWITVVGYIYNQMPNLLAPGALARASAGAVVLLIIILLITILQFVVSKKRVHY